MSDIENQDSRRLEGPQDTRGEYVGTGDDVRIGIEVEYQFTSQRRGGAPMDVTENAALEKSVFAKGGAISQEATAQTVEIKTEAYTHDDFGSLTAEFNKHYNVLAAAAQDNDLTMHDKANLQDAKFPEMLANLHPRERVQILYDYFLRHNREDAAEYFSKVSGTQISVSYEDEQHGHDIYKRMVFLAPLLASLYGNATEKVVNEQGLLSPVDHNFTLRQRLSVYGAEKSVAQAFWKAADAEDFFDAANEELWNQDAFCYFDKDGQFTAADQPEDVKTFAELPRDLRHMANFQMLSSVQWHLVDLSHLPLPNGDLKRRIELRYLDTMPKDKILGLTRFVSAMAFDPEFAGEVDRFIARAGFDLQKPENSRDLWVKSLLDAANSDPKNAVAGGPQFGNVSHQYAREYMNDLLARYAGRYPEFADICPPVARPQKQQTLQAKAV